LAALVSHSQAQKLFQSDSKPIQPWADLGSSNKNAKGGQDKNILEGKIELYCTRAIFST